MSRKIYDEDIRLNLILNGKGIQQGNKALVGELGKLEREFIDLEQRAMVLSKRIKDLSRDEKGNAATLKMLRKEQAANTDAMNAMSKRILDLRKNIGLTGMTLQQLNTHLKALKVQLYNIRGNTFLEKQLRKEIRATEVEITRITTGATRLQQAWERMARAANKMGTIMGWAMLAFYGFWRIIDRFVFRMKDLEDTIGNVRKTTNLTRDEVWKLKETFDQWDTRTKTKDLLEMARVAGRLGVQGRDDVLGFVKAANMIQVALGDDLNGDVEETMRSVGKLVNAFRLTEKMPLEEAMIKIGSVLNEMDKNSEAMAANVLEYMTRWSAMGETAGITAAQFAGLGATLDMMNVGAERGSTAVQKLLLTMGERDKIGHFAHLMGLTAEEYKKLVDNSPNEAFLQLLGTFSKSTQGLTQLVAALDEYGIDAERTTQVFGVLIKNLDVLREQQDIATEAFKRGVSIMEEYEIMNRNFAGEIEVQRKRLGAVTEQLGKKLEPTLLSIVRGWTRFVIAIKNAAEWLSEHSGLIRTLIAALVLLKTRWLALNAVIFLNNKLGKEGMLMTKLRIFWMQMEALWTKNLTGAQKGLIHTSKSLTVANLILTGQFKELIRITRLWVAANKLSAVAIAGGVLTAVLGLAAAFLLLRKRTENHVKSVEEFSRKLKDLKQNTNDLFNQMRRLNPQSEKFNQLNDTLLDMYPDILKNYDLAKTGLIGIEEAQRAVNEQLERNVMIESKKQDIEKLDETYKGKADKWIRRVQQMTEDEVTGATWRAEMENIYEELSANIIIPDEAIRQFNQIAGFGKYSSEGREVKRIITQLSELKKGYMEARLAIDEYYMARYKLGFLAGMPKEGLDVKKKPEDDISKTIWTKDEFSNEKDRYEKELIEFNLIRTKQAHEENKDEEWLRQQKLDGEIVFQKQMIELLEHYPYKEKEKELLEARLRLYELYLEKRGKKEKEEKLREEKEQDEAKAAKNNMDAEIEALNAYYDRQQVLLLKKRVADKISDETYARDSARNEMDREKELTVLYQEWSGNMADLTAQTRDRLLQMEIKYNQATTNEAKNKYLKEIELLQKYLDNYSEWSVDAQYQSMQHYKNMYDKANGYRTSTLSEEEELYQRLRKNNDQMMMEYEASLSRLFTRTKKERGEELGDREKFNLRMMEKERDRMQSELDARKAMAEKIPEMEEELRQLEEEREKETDYERKMALDRLIAQKQSELAQRQELNNEIAQMELDLAAMEKNIWEEKVAFIEKQIDKLDKTNRDYLSKVMAFSKELKKTMSDTKMDPSLREEKELKLKEKIIEANEQEALSWASSARSAVENAETTEEATVAVLNAVRQRISALLAEAVATQIVNALKSSGGNPILGLLAAAGAAGATALLFESLVPKFSTGENGKIKTSTMLGQHAEGRYPVTGADDRRQYYATYSGPVRTGIYGKPTVMDFSDGQKLVGETRLPELVIDGKTFRKMQLDAPGLVNAIYAMAGKMPQYASGHYPQVPGAQTAGFDRNTLETLQRFAETMDRISRNGINAFIPLYGKNSFDAAQTKVNTYRNQHPKGRN